MSCITREIDPTSKQHLLTTVEDRSHNRHQHHAAAARVSRSTPAARCSPGQGAGLFITYTAGGHWKLEWSCDTNVSKSHACNFEIAIGATGYGELATTPASAVFPKMFFVSGGALSTAPTDPFELRPPNRDSAQHLGSSRKPTRSACAVACGSSAGAAWTSGR